MAAQRVAIVDYGMCNLDSVRRAFEEVGARPYVTDDPADLDAALAKQVLHEGAPFLGVCLGMQLMAAIGEENVTTDGLGWIDARCVRLVPTAVDRRVPHIGWNQVTPTVESPLFAGIPEGTDFYFVHSFHVLCAERADVLATTPYCDVFVSAVQRGEAFGVQFHPEKSQQWGLRLLRNFLAV
jgi:glutamine amidotransferase